jgi:FkbM family methyltransferase
MAAEVKFEQWGWYGLKPIVKAALEAPLFNAGMTRALRAVERPDLFSRLPVRRTSVEGYALGQPYHMLRPRRCAIAKELFWGRGFRVDQSERLSLATMATLAQRADVLFDIGANTGIFTVACCAAAPQLRAHAFEILPEAFLLLYENCAYNDLLSRVECHHVGLGAEETVARLPSGRFSSSIAMSFSSETAVDDGISVGFRRWDDPAWRPADTDRVIVKIDVEGTEFAVIESGLGLVAEFTPTIHMEVLPGTSVEPFHEIFDGLGYRYYHFRHGPRLVREEKLEGRRDGRDWLLTCEPEDVVEAAISSADAY